LKSPRCFASAFILKSPRCFAKPFGTLVSESRKLTASEARTI